MGYTAIKLAHLNAFQINRFTSPEKRSACFNGIMNEKAGKQGTMRYRLQSTTLLTGKGVVRAK